MRGPPPQSRCYARNTSIVFARVPLRRKPCACTNKPHRRHRTDGRSLDRRSESSSSSLPAPCLRSRRFCAVAKQPIKKGSTLVRLPALAVNHRPDRPPNLHFLGDRATRTASPLTARRLSRPHARAPQVRIPREAIILPNDVRDAPVLSAAASWAEEHQPPDGLSDWQLLCLWLIWHEHLGPESAWAPYLAVVPQQAQMAAALSHPLIWPEAVAESLLAGSSLLVRSDF